MISLVIPTYNEEESISDLICRIADMAGINSLLMEIIIVDDDSGDNTVSQARIAIAKCGNIKGKLIVRKDKNRSLSLSVIDGIQAAAGDIIGIMDADFSHPPEAIPSLVRAISEDGFDLAVGSRYIKGGGIAGWPIKRRISSWAACKLAAGVTDIRDATSGFLFFKRSVIKNIALLNPVGFKIGLEIIVKCEYKRAAEIPYLFSERIAGRSKFGLREIALYMKHLAALYTYVIRKTLKGAACIYPL